MTPEPAGLPAEMRAIDEVFGLPDARAALERSLERDTRGKVILRVAGEGE
jgi:hypothetical protein